MAHGSHGHCLVSKVSDLLDGNDVRIGYAIVSLKLPYVMWMF